MAYKNIEIEIQCRISDVKGLTDFLNDNGEFLYESHQLDEYFSPAHRDFLATRPVNEWFRVRNTDGVYCMAYKKWHRNEEEVSGYCDEFETEIGDINTVKKILKVLDFSHVVTVDKIRKAWNYHDYEVTVDKIKDLGEFVEIEYIGEDENVDSYVVSQEMVEFLKNTNCGKVEQNTVGYAYFMLFPEEGNWQAK